MKPSDAQVDVSNPSTAEMPSSRGALMRWFGATATFSVPQAASPVAFSLLALSATGDTGPGAALILVMTFAQVVGAVPITRLGRRFPAARFLRTLILIRTLALVLMAAFAASGAPFAWLFVFAAMAGTVNGAAFAYLRSVLNRLTTAAKLPRALGIAATLNEVTFVLAPVAASGLGTVSPVFAVSALAIIGAAPALLVPDVGSAPVGGLPAAKTSILSPSIAMWLMCAAASGAAVAAIEIGAVALALELDYRPTLAILFTVPLCLASIAGGIWVSVRNRTAAPRTIVLQLSVMTAGIALAACQLSLAATVAGAVMIGSVLAPLGTYYSLVLDGLAPPDKRPEVFALLRTSNAVGVIFTSGLLTAVAISMALIVVAMLMLLATLIVSAVSLARRRPMGEAVASDGNRNG